MTNITDELGDEQLICAMLQRKISFVSAIGDREQQAQLVGELAIHAQATGNHHWYATARYARAYYQYQISEYDAVRASISEVLPLYQQLDDRAAQVECLCLLADSAANQGQIEEASSLLEQARALSSPDNQALLLRILSVTANAAVLQNNYEVGYHLSLQALAISRALQDREAEADAYNRLAAVTEQAARYQDAVGYYEQAMALHEALGKPKGMAIALGNIGILYGRVGRYAEAAAAFRRSEALYKSVNNILGQVLNTINMADTANIYHDYRLAASAAKRGLELVKAINNPLLESDLLCNLAVAELGLGELAAARQHLETSLTVRRELGSASFEELAEDLCYLAITHLRAGNLAAAQQTSDEALGLPDEGEEQSFSREYVLWIAACVARAGGDTSRAADYLAASYPPIARNLIAREQELADYPPSQWRPAFLAHYFNGDIITAYERDQWPNYAMPAV
jgi:tetratricopeptide (TPR) repeat protein